MKPFIEGDTNECINWEWKAGAEKEAGRQAFNALAWGEIAEFLGEQEPMDPANYEFVHEDEGGRRAGEFS